MSKAWSVVADLGSRRAKWMVLATALVVSFGFWGELAARASAAGSSISITSDGPNPQPTGAASTYTIDFTCSSVASDTCGTDPTITIPLNLTSSTPVTPDMATWAYSASSSPAGIILSAGVEGENYVIHLDPTQVVPGDSDSITLSVAPPNNITPDGTAWSLQPSFASDEIPEVVAPDAAPGSATADALLSVSKNTNDGGSIYVVGNNVIYDITAQCNPGSSSGNLYLTSGSLVDALPPQLTFVSASPAPSSVSGQTVTWDYPASGGLPRGCSGDGTGSTTYQLVTTLNSNTPDDTVVPNDITFTGTPIGTTTPESTTAEKRITAVETSPSPAGDFLSKSALGPLSIPGLGPNGTPGFQGTYAGHWIRPINPTPSASNPGAAEGQYTVSLNYGTSRAFTTDLVDPVPCLTAPNGVVYSSSTVTGPLTSAGSPTIDSLCTAPAFNPTVVRVNAAGLAAAVAGGWRPFAILTNGTRVNLTLQSGVYFEVPAADVGHVAAVELPPNLNLNDVSMSMTVWGYADDSFSGGEVLHDIASATAYPTTGSDVPNTESDTADLYIEPDYPQLGVFKSFVPATVPSGGTTTLTLQGTLALVSPPDGNVVLTDLLPPLLSWNVNLPHPSTASFSLTAEQGGPVSSVTGTITDIPNFDGSGRELIRVSFPASAFSSGFYTITAPPNLVQITVPAGAATYDNTDQLFINNSGDGPRSTCGPGTGTTAATFESSDPMDLDGDGATEQNYCEYPATLTVNPPSGSSFRLVKTVQGDQDSAPKFPGGIGDASPGGSGVYTLNWTNTGSTTLSDPVIYDIFPYVGDTGVSENQALQQRNSKFATIFAGVSGTLAAGVTIAYSESTNPCRPEVYPAAPNCVNDWTTTAPADLGLVKAVRITSANSYSSRQSFAVSVKVDVPSDTVNIIAWNTAATSAKGPNGSYLPPAEPVEVGLEAPGPPATPTLSTQTSATDVQPGDSFRDTVTVGGTEGGSGTLTWTRVGPIPPAADGSCSGLDWSGATSGPTGTLPITGDGSQTIPSISATQAGCYSFVVGLTGPVFSGPVTTAAGDPGETVLVHAADITSTASAVRILPGGSVTDSVTLSGRGVGAGTLDWSLVGPLPRAADGTCNALLWNGAATADSGTIAVTGDGTSDTPASSPSATGCYSYVSQLTDDSVGGPALSPAGASGETFLVARPDVSTAISSSSIETHGSVSDQITVGGTGGAPGTLAWTLEGPVPVVSGSCSAADWTSAPTVAQGTIDVGGDGVYGTPSAAIDAPGCYGYTVTLTGAAYGGPVTSAVGATGEVADAVSPAVIVPPPAATAQAAHLTIVKRVNDHTVIVGHDLRYQLTVTNSGPGTATDVKIVDSPKTRFKLISAKPSSGSCDTGLPLTCTIGSLGPEDHASVTVVARPLEAGTLVNTGHVETTALNTAPPGSVYSQASTEVRVPLALTKSASRPTVHAGHDLDYTIVIANPTSVIARRVALCDQLPAGLVYRSASIHFKLHNGSRCTTIAAVGPHRRIALTIRVHVLRGARGRTVNRATLSGADVVARRASARATVIASPPPGGGVTG